MRTGLVATARTAVALLAFAALVTEVATLLAQHRFAAANFLSYFTVEANTLAVLSLLLSSHAVLAGRRGTALDFFRGGVALCMTTVFAVFVVLLSGYPASELTAVPWDNVVLHYIAPIAVLLDWLVASPVEPVPQTRALAWLLIPLAYLVYSEIRGALVGWYPYPFLDPAPHGYARVASTVLVTAVVVAVLGAAVAASTRLPHRRLTGVSRP